MKCLCIARVLPTLQQNSDCCLLESLSVSAMLMTGTVCTCGSSLVFVCCLVQSLCSSIHAYELDFVHGKLAVSLSKQLRVHFV